MSCRSGGCNNSIDQLIVMELTFHKHPPIKNQDAQDVVVAYMEWSLTTMVYGKFNNLTHLYIFLLVALLELKPCPQLFLIEALSS